MIRRQNKAFSKLKSETTEKSHSWWKLRRSTVPGKQTISPRPASGAPPTGRVPPDLPQERGATASPLTCPGSAPHQPRPPWPAPGARRPPSTPDLPQERSPSSPPPLPRPPPHPSSHLHSLWSRPSSWRRTAPAPRGKHRTHVTVAQHSRPGAPHRGVTQPLCWGSQRSLSPGLPVSRLPPLGPSSPSTGET